MIDKVNLQRTLDRRVAFYERCMDAGILVKLHISRPASAASVPVAARVRGCLALEDLEGCIRRARAVVESLRDNPSDVIPDIYPTLPFGESVWAGLLGGEIEFSGTDEATWSYCRNPPVADLARFEFPRLDPDNRWFRAMMESTRHHVAAMEPICDAIPFIFLDCLNLLVELRGACTAYTDLYDYPEQMDRFMDWSVGVNMQLYDAQAVLMRDFVDAAFDGHAYAKYSIARIPSLSVDANNMCDAGMYRRWGLPQHQRIVRNYGGGRLHIHGNGRHLCELVSEIQGLTSCCMGDDVGYPPAWTVVGELIKRMDPVPIEVSMPLAPFAEGLRRQTLPPGVCYHVDVNSMAEAERIMREVINYRASGDGG